MIDISVIIPVYKGTEYIAYWIKILEKNIDNFRTRYNMECEVILVNDYPEKEVKLQNENIDIHVYNLEHNRGVHGARVFGLYRAKGRYVVFFDQDDKISENYLVSQRQHIEDADAVVCNGFIEQLCMVSKRAIYTDDSQLEGTMNLQNYINSGNSIASPGQVLIRKNAIPQFWLTEVIKKNGADDFYLWLLMLGNNCKFTINKQKIFTYIKHENNTSSMIENMHESVLEVISVLKKSEILDSKDIERLYKREIQESRNARHYLEIIRVYDYWMYLKIRNIKIETYLLEHNYRKIAIYGVNYIGNRFYDELKGSQIDVVFCIDRRAESIRFEVPIVCLGNISLGEKLEEIDAVVVTAIDSCLDILCDIQKKYDGPVLLFKDILFNLINDI